MPISPQTPLAVDMTLMSDDNPMIVFKIVFEGNVDNWWLVEGEWTLDGMQFSEDRTWGDWHVEDVRNNFSIIGQ